MKKLGVLTTVISLFLLFTLTACETEGQRHTKAIQSVFEQLDKSTTELKANINDKKMDWYKAQQQYQAQLNNIDLLACPADFQSVFLDYISVYRETIRMANERRENYWTYSFLDALHVLGSATGLSKEATPFINEKDAQIGKFEAAFMEVKKVGLRYGVQYK